MQFLMNTRTFKIEEPTVVTIGKFDGRHRGHQKLLEQMRRYKEEYGYKIAVFTFATTPASLVNKTLQTVITTNEERRLSMESAGVDYLVEYPFDRQAARMSPEEFVNIILVNQMHARAIVVGSDCGFGYQRAGNAALLEQLSDKYGYQLCVIDKEQDGSRDISSTYVREELDQGNMEKANELLGSPYSIHGTVVHGNHIGGSILGFPTANILPPPEKHLPPFGVYVSQVMVDGKLYGGVTNLGKKPTVHGDSPVGVETFIFGLTEDLYGKPLEVRLLNFQRPERKFDSMEQLKEQIEKDKQYSQEYLSKYVGL